MGKKKGKKTKASRKAQLAFSELVSVMSGQDQAARPAGHGHGHSHGGAKAAGAGHGHSHGGKPCHGHGGAAAGGGHGHSHGPMSVKQHGPLHNDGGGGGAAAAAAAARQGHAHGPAAPRDVAAEVAELMPVVAKLVEAQASEAPEAAAVVAGTAAPAPAAAWERFREWFRAEAPESGLGAKWDVQADLAEGSGVVATADLAKGEEYMHIPLRVMITQQTVERSPLIGEFVRNDRLCRQMPWVGLALFVALEYRRPDSFWRAYLDVLPRRYDLPIMFSADELEEMRGSPTHNDAVMLVKSVLRHYMYMTRALQAIEGAPALTFDEFRRGVAVVMSRQNPIPGPDGTRTVALIPGFDFTNHTNGDRITTVFNGETGVSESTTADAVAKGDQIRLYYGDRPNGALYLYQGFVLDDHATDRVALFARRPPVGAGADAVARIQAVMMSKRGFNPFAERFELSKQAPVHRRMVDFCRLACLTKEEAAFCLKNPDAERISDRNERAALEMVAAFLDAAAGTYPTTLEADEELLGAAEPLPPRRQLVVRLRATEKRLIRMAQTRVAVMLAELDAEQQPGAGAEAKAADDEPGAVEI